ncbi:MAG TPA: hypothetical protein VFR87_16775 [Nocardioidaceae bacterium]|nr:hypothetical protein [Nocardioidaceae bacterium]
MNATTLWAVLVPLSNDITTEEDYRPGWLLFALIMFLVLAVVVLGLSFRKQLRKADKHFLPPDGSGKGGMIGDSDSAGGEDRRD